MSPSVKITYRNMDTSPYLTRLLRGHIEELESLCDSITKVEVVISIPHRRHNKGHHYRLRIAMHVPSQVLVVSRAPSKKSAHEDPYVAVRDAFRAARRELRDYAAKRHIKVKQHVEHTLSGTISQIFPREGYGFLKTEDEREVYFHENSLRGASIIEIEVGQEVTFAEEPGDKGPQAVYVLVEPEDWTEEESVVWTEAVEDWAGEPYG